MLIQEVISNVNKITISNNLMFNNKEDNNNQEAIKLTMKMRIQ